jgi:plasmid stabilization system protein ParE
MTLVVAPDALEDVDAAAVRLNGERPGHGDVLNDLFAAALTAIGSEPRRFARCEDGPDGIEFREAYIARFGYRVIFTARDADVVEVVAVIHVRRRPGAWADRLNDRN